MVSGIKTIFFAAFLFVALSSAFAPRVLAQPASNNSPPVAAPLTPVTAAPLPKAVPPMASTVEFFPIPDAAKPGADGKMDAEAATKAYLAYISGDARKKSDAYFEGGYWLILWDTLYALAVAGILLWSRFSARMRNLATRMTGSRFLQVPIYAIQYIIVSALLSFPLTVYEDFIREHKYGLSNQDFAGWFGDFIKLFGVELLVLTVVMTVFYAFMRWTKDNWWKWATLIGVVFMFFIVMLAPVYVSPLINDYKPLPESPIKEQILSLARANGVPATNVYKFNASKQSKRVSANVSGLLGTTRISMNDNLMNRSTPAEIRAVLGHEMGHYVLGHNYTFLTWFVIMLFVALSFANWGFKRLAARFGNAWGVHDIADPAGMPAIFALIAVIGFFGTPVTNTATRFQEGQADIFGLNAAREPDGFAEAALKLSEYRKLEPAPWEEIVFYDHPSGHTRIAMAMQWKAEHAGDLDMVEKAKTPLQ